ncbi:MAG: phosphatidylserine/phosphatidylglycerophosphate/cardiolipin synthase family protein [Bacteroidetes bacterium]|nr:phosphatidylserine/phosphatidylglycerophosphate/cardiolipin synthase family protein [Bacteroidota bacterium]
MSNSNYQIFEKAPDFYALMLDDIAQAREYIYLEMYKFSDGPAGHLFRDALTRKAKEGIEVKLLIDSWGAYVTEASFTQLIQSGGEVRFFKKIKFFIDFFTKNHRRNHRKILVIDDKITWLGSANIVDYAMDWRDLMVRMVDDIAVHFKHIFLQDFRIYKRYVFEKPSYVRTIKHREFEIIRDVPSMAMQKLRKRYLDIIKSAKKEIVIETPYFLPGLMLRKSLIDAAHRGVDVKVIMPKHSDLRLVDILRNRYIGLMCRHNVGFLFYIPGNLHGKCVLIDSKVFSIASSNFDYRSFRYQHEIAIIGRNQQILDLLGVHIKDTIKNSEPFDYEHWLKRPFPDKLFERLLIPFRHLF